MVIGILAAVLGLLLATAAIVIPRMVARRNDPGDDAASRAYLASTGRSAKEVEQANRGRQAPPDGRPQAGLLRADGVVPAGQVMLSSLEDRDPGAGPWPHAASPGCAYRASTRATCAMPCPQAVICPAGR